MTTNRAVRRDELGSVFDELQTLSRRLRRRLHERYPQLTPGDVTLLDLIDSSERVTAAELSSLLSLDKSTISRQLASLERRGLIARVDNPSHPRAQSLVVTRTAAAMLADARKAYLADLTRRLESWSNEDLDRFGRLLRRFNADDDVGSDTGRY